MSTLATFHEKETDPITRLATRVGVLEQTLEIARDYIGRGWHKEAVEAIDRAMPRKIPDTPRADAEPMTQGDPMGSGRQRPNSGFDSRDGGHIHKPAA